MGVDKYARLDRPYRLHGTAPLSQERLAQIAEVLRAARVPVKVGG
jgi:hypothetical protein